MKILDMFEPEMFPTGSCFEHLFTDGSEFWGGVYGNSIKMLPRCWHGQLRQEYEYYDSVLFLFPSFLPTA